MLFRFSLYGFLKNQRYFEPFLILAFLEKGLSFTEIGLLIGFREVCVNLMEVPTGAIADVLGRRRAMIFSSLGYIASFAVFGLLEPVWALFLAMFLFSIGEAFRTGTHKAMIFDWLSSQGRAGEKTKVYGFTRSWSQIGSAVSVVIAAGMVFTTKRYSAVFLASIPPYLANIVNFLTYPRSLDGVAPERPSLGAVWRALAGSFRDCLSRRPLRRLLAEGMGFDGTYKAVKDYLQPVLKAAALGLPVVIGLTDRQRTAVLVGAIYFVLYLLSSYASRHSDTLRRRAGSEDRAARWLWWVDLAAFATLAAGVVAGAGFLAVGAFVVLAVLENSWRPILVSRFAEHADASKMATVLSIESQARSLFSAALAPLVGLAVDAMGRLAGPAGGGDLRFLPIGVAGMVIASLMLATGRRAPAAGQSGG